MIISTTTGFQKLGTDTCSYMLKAILPKGKPWLDLHEAIKSYYIPGSQKVKSFSDVTPHLGRENGFWCTADTTIPEGTILMLQGSHSMAYPDRSPGKETRGYVFLRARQEAALIVIKARRGAGAADAVRGKFDVITPRDLGTEGIYVNPAAIMYVNKSSPNGNDIFNIEQLVPASCLPKRVAKRVVSKVDGEVEVIETVSRRKVNI